MPVRPISIRSSSGNVRFVTWDDETLDLTVQFKGGTYIAKNVSELDALGFEQADSAGRYYNDTIKDQHVVTRVG